MDARIFITFGLGALVGYVAHREPVAPAAPRPQPQLQQPAAAAAAHAPPAQAQPPPRIVVVGAPDDESGAEPERSPETAGEGGGENCGGGENADSAEAQPEAQGVLQGKVIDARTGEGIYRVQVVAESPVTPPFRTWTEQDGTYRLEHMPGVAYTVHFRYYDIAHTDLTAGVSQLDPTTLDARLDVE
jgi:hypothetical protein